jgi:KRAB domain-containing zinc finger protein
MYFIEFNTCMVESDVWESSSNQPFKCFCCETSFEALNELTWHIAEFHENTKSFVCNICSAEFLQIEELENHSTGHIVKVHNEKGKNPQNLKKKTKLVNKVKKKKYFCEICNAKFSNGCDVKRHFEQVHEKKGPYSCDICSSSFSRESDKTKHIEEVHEGKKPHVCDICAKCFSRKNHLNVHISAVHEKAEKKNVCDLCDYR